MIKNRFNIVLGLCLLLFSLVVFSQGLDTHGLEYRDDEVFYYKSTQEMVHDGNYLSPTYFGQDRFQKPILFYWLVIFSYKLFGINWFAARFVSVFFASLTLIIVWILASDLFNRKTASLSTLILMTSPMFFRHAKNVVPDIVLNFFIVLAIYFGFKQIDVCLQSRPAQKLDFKKSNVFTREQVYSLLFVVSCSLGFMVKGYAALIVPILTVGAYALFTKRIRALFCGNHLLNIVVGSLIILPWFVYMVKVHGDAYVNHMVVQETQGRILSDPSCNTFWAWLKMFAQHLLYYFQIIFSYFAPWSIFFVAAIPYAFYKASGDSSSKDGLFLSLTWISVAILFFSSLYFVINHYMLAISAPFAILTGHFLSASLESPRGVFKAVPFLRKYLLMAIFALGFLVFSFLFFFLLKGLKFWIPLFLVVFCGGLWMMWKKDHYWRAVILAGFIVFVLSQSNLLNNAKLTSHAVLRGFAHAINEETVPQEDFLIGVGSHDLHEKEFQVYFDRKVDKASVSWEWGMEESLRKYFSQRGEIYCLITLKDYDKYLTRIPNFKDLEVIREDYIFRKRMKIDKNFFKALLLFDQEAVHEYLKEKILLVRKEDNDEQ